MRATLCASSDLTPVAMDDGVYKRNRAQEKNQQEFANDPKGPVGVSLRAVKTLGPDFSRRNPRQSFLPVRLLLQGSVTTGNQSSGSAAVVDWLRDADFDC